MNKTIHQVYGVFNDGVKLEDIPIFHKQTTITKQFCNKHDINYKLWNYHMCEELIDKYPDYRILYDSFRFPIQKADFIRYLILYDEGGIYVDCDICPIADISHLFELQQFFVIWNNDKKKLPYNAVLGSFQGNPVYEKIFDEIIKSVQEKDKIDVYKKWTGRYVFQTTGHHMLQRVIKQYSSYTDMYKLDVLKIHSKKDIIISSDNPLFEDYNASIWYQG